MKTKRIARWLAAVLALSLLSGCAHTARTPAPTTAPTAVPTAAPTPAPTPSPAPTPEPTAVSTLALTEIPLCADGIHADVAFEDMRWYLYDMTEFNARAEALARTGDEIEAQALYDWLLTEYDRISTLDELAWIWFYRDGTEDSSAACQVTDEILTQAGDTLHAAVADALAGPLPGDFAEYVGRDNAEILSDYEEMTDRETEILRRETELELAYNELMSEEGFSEPELNYRAGEILLELVALRNELAVIYGYDSFADYAYEVYYARDFTPAEAARLCEEIKPYARGYYKNCCYCSAFYADMHGRDNRSGEELLGLLRGFAPEISPRAAEAEKYMEDHGLYCLRNDVAEMGFTTSLPLYNAPFLFNSLYGTIYDIQSTFHEFGHYYDAYINPPENTLTEMGSFDIFEIHSTGLEALSYGWYDEIFGDAAEEAKIWCLDGLMYNIISGCIYDEFQQYLYAHPDMTVDEINAAYARIAQSYGRELYSNSEAYEWIYVSHNFESPLYYISYAVSTLASVQLWSLSQEDRAAAFRLYNRLVERGAFDVGYVELMGEMGLRSFTDGLEPALRDFYDELESMCLRYDSLSKAA